MSLDNQEMFFEKDFSFLKFDFWSVNREASQQFLIFPQLIEIPN